MKRIAACLIVVGCLGGLCVSALCARPEPTPVQTRLKRVALFKNGVGFFVREGTLPGEGSIALLGPFAAPSHGTFWVSCPGRAGLRGVVAREVKTGEMVEAREVAELLRANVGKEVTIWTSESPESAVRGRIIAFAPDRMPKPPDAYVMGSAPERYPFVPIGRGQYVLLQTEDGVRAVDPYRVWSVQFHAAEVARSFEQEVREVALEVSLASPKGGDWVSASYLAKGITWAPSYLVDISDAKQARLAAKALIVNEAEDLEGADVDLVTGFPNLQFADVLSPIGMKEGLAGFLASLVRGRSTVEQAQVMLQAVSYESYGRRGGVGGGGGGGRAAIGAPDYGVAAAGAEAEDLFLYPLEGVTLAKGDTGYYPLFTESVPYTEFYQWEVPDYVTQEDLYGQPRREEREKPEEVWHALRMRNTMEAPWTTAPAQLMKEGQIIGQDTLKYTPPKAEATVRVTQAVSVKAEQKEVEVARRREAAHMYGYVFDQVTILGTLRATNYKEEAIDLEVSKTVSGDVMEATPPATDVALARGLGRMNPVHVLKWELHLDPGELAEMTYTYEVLIRR